MKLATGPQIRAGRALLGLDQIPLAEAAGVSPTTLRKIEQSQDLPDVRIGTIRALQRALEKAGIEFLNGDQPGVRLKRREGVTA